MDGIAQKKRIEIVCCYAREDQHHLAQLRRHVTLWERQELFSLWHDGEISPGTDWRRAILRNLHSAHIILLLISPDFLASDYCYSTELKIAMERFERGETLVIPIILRPCAWEEAPFGRIQALPASAEPVLSSRWHNVDEAFTDVARGIRQVVEDLRQASAQEEARANEALQSEIDAASVEVKCSSAQVRSTRPAPDWKSMPEQTSAQKPTPLPDQKPAPGWEPKLKRASMQKAALDWKSMAERASTQKPEQSPDQKLASAPDNAPALSQASAPDQPPIYENADEHQEHGLVVWDRKKRAYVIWFEEQQALELQGYLTPGAYSFRFLKNAGTILSATAISDAELVATYFAKHGISIDPGVTHEDQARQIYQKALCDLFHFHYEDLAHNRKHMLSPEQYKKFTKKGRILLFFSWVGLLSILGMCGWSIAVSITGAAPWEFVLTVPGLILFLGAHSAQKHQDLYVEEVRSNRVKSEDGPLTRRTEMVTTVNDQGGFSEEVSIYEIKRHRLPAGGHELFSSVPYRLYLLPKSETFVSVEALEAPRRIGKPGS